MPGPPDITCFLLYNVEINVLVGKKDIGHISAVLGCKALENVRGHTVTLACENGIGDLRIGLVGMSAVIIKALDILRIALELLILCEVCIKD